MLPSVDVPGHGALRLPGFPVNSAEENRVPHRPAPRLGEHTREALRAGGCAEGEIDRLLATGIVRESAGLPR
jgi:crotonobetainyl-CoA:carnitine CoA-transferase CaiB-like acyl-CoA transferase